MSRINLYLKLALEFVAKKRLILLTIATLTLAYLSFVQVASPLRDEATINYLKYIQLKYPHADSERFESYETYGYIIENNQIQFYEKAIKALEKEFLKNPKNSKPLKLLSKIFISQMDNHLLSPQVSFYKNFENVLHHNNETQFEAYLIEMLIHLRNKETTDAKASLKQSLQYATDTTSKHIAQGYFVKHDSEHMQPSIKVTASRLYTATEEDHPYFYEAHNLACDLYFLDANYVKAYESIQRRLQKSPNHMESRIDLANFHIQTKNYRSAEGLIKENLEIHPSNMASMIQLIELYLLRNKLSNANDFIQSIQLGFKGAQYSNFLNQVGFLKMLILFTNKQGLAKTLPRKALSHKIIEDYPLISSYRYQNIELNESYSNRLLEMYLHKIITTHQSFIKNDSKIAFDSIKNFIEKEKPESLLVYLYAIFLGLDSKEKILAKLINQAIFSADIFFEKDQTENFQERYIANHTLKKLQFNSSSFEKSGLQKVEILTLLSIFHTYRYIHSNQTKDLKSSFLHINKALTLSPKLSKLRLLKAILLTLSGENKKSLNELRIAQDNDPGDKRILLWKGKVLFNLKRYNEARPILLKASRTSSNEINAKYFLSLIEEKKGSQMESQNYLYDILKKNSGYLPALNLYLKKNSKRSLF